MAIVETLDRIFYPTVSNGWDDASLRERIIPHIRPDSVILDLGAGSGLVKEMNFRGLCRTVCGLDPVEEVLQNPNLDSAAVGMGDKIPWPDRHFDLVFSNNVLEHLANPEIVFQEVYRVLKPGGVFLVKTPNRYHYVAGISSLTPHTIHVVVNKIRGRAESDTFPTLYRANTRRRLIELSRSFEQLAIEQIEKRPEYTRHGVLAALYPLGLLWERAVNSTQLLSPFRVILIGQFRKPLNAS